MSYPVPRREALLRMALGGAGAVAVPGWAEALSAFAADHAHEMQRQRAAARPGPWKPKVLTPAQNLTVVALSELIIPQTDTAGAKAAKVNEFIDFVLNEANPDERKRFADGLAWIDARSEKDFGKPFVGATPEQQVSLLQIIAAPPAAEAGQSAPDKTGADFFLAIKSLTITGYYTSEVGLREEIGDDGTMAFAEFKGCTHPEHQG
jgi:hypothetical protein